MKTLTNHEIPAPQSRLAAGILAQARRDLRRFHSSTRKLERELYLDAYDWVVSEDSRWPFSFRNVCQILSLPAETVRHELFRDVSLGMFHYWSRRFGSALRRFHISLRQVATDETVKTGTLVHTLS